MLQFIFYAETTTFNEITHNMWFIKGALLHFFLSIQIWFICHYFEQMRKTVLRLLTSNVNFFVLQWHDRYFLRRSIYCPYFFSIIIPILVLCMAYLRMAYLSRPWFYVIEDALNFSIYCTVFTFRMVSRSLSKNHIETAGFFLNREKNIILALRIQTCKP